MTLLSTLLVIYVVLVLVRLTLEDLSNFQSLCCTQCKKMKSVACSGSADYPGWYFCLIEAAE